MKELLKRDISFNQQKKGRKKRKKERERETECEIGMKKEARRQIENHRVERERN